MRLLLMAFTLQASGCTAIHYKDLDSEFSRWSFGTNLQIVGLSATKASDGSRSVQMEGYTSDQVESLKAVAEGVAKGISSTIKP